MNKCVFCGGRVETKLVTFSYEDDGKRLLVEHVPADVCEQCGEQTYAPDVADELLRFAGNEFKPVKIIEVPVFDYAESC
ncbi:MAG: type II toxin-antitoxin system MqsA family antitoxin [Nitrospirae bacterium]|nr:type II toxin-antitoxin system MqsA family antitoxin [Nitrospirota bacterium]